MKFESSEFGSLEVKAFDGSICPVKSSNLSGCVVNKLLKGEDIDHLLGSKSSLGEFDQSFRWELNCAACGLVKPFQIVSNDAFELKDGQAEMKTLTLSKTGAQRAKESAVETTVDLARKFGLPSEGIQQAAKLFNLFHLNGSSSGGRGHKTTSSAAIRVASLQANMPIPMKQICDAHPDNPTPSIVNRYVSSVWRTGLIRRPMPDASDIILLYLDRIGASDEIRDEAVRVASLAFPNLRSDHLAAGALYFAARSNFANSRKYSVKRISEISSVSTTSIRRAYNKISDMHSSVPKRNPRKARVHLQADIRVPNLSEPVPSSDIKLLREIRRGSS